MYFASVNSAFVFIFPFTSIEKFRAKVMRQKTFMKYVTFSTIQCHLYNLKIVKSTHRGVLLLVTLLASTCNFTKSNTPPCVFFAFFKIAQMVANRANHHI